MMVDNAMAMCFSLSSSFNERHRDLSSFDLIIQFIGAGSFYYDAMYQQVQYDLERKTGQDHQETSTKSWSDLLCSHAWRGLSDFRDLQDYVWMSDGERGKTYGSKKPFLRFPGHPFSRILASVAFDIKDLFPEIAQWTKDQTGAAAFPQAVSILDPYTSRLVLFCQERRMCTGLVAASQIYLEMFDALNGDFDRCYHELSALVQRAELLRLSPSRIEIQDRVYSKWSAFCSVGADANGRTGWYVPSRPSEALETSRVFVPASFLSAMPLLASHRAYKTLWAHQGNIRLHPGIIDEVSSAAYLYKAAQLSGSIKKPWVDMDFFLTRQEAFQKSSWWSGEKTMRSLANSFGMSLGLSAHEVSGAKVPVLPKPERAKKAKGEPVLLLHFMAAYWDAMRQGCYLRLEINMRMLYKLAEVQACSKGGIQDQTIAEQWSKTRRLSPIQLLQVAQEVLIEDDPYIHFDYYTFSDQCIEWCCLAESCFFDATHKTPTRKSHAYPYNYHVLHGMLWDAAMAEMRGISMERTSLHQLGMSMQNSSPFNAGSSDCTRRALEISSGHLSASHKPSVLYANHLQQPTMRIMHIDYAEIPSLDNVNILELLAETVHPNEEMLVKGGYEAITKAMEVDGLDVETAASRVEELMVARYKSYLVMKRPLVRVENGVAVITTVPWTWEEITQTYAAANSDYKDENMRCGIRFV